MAVTIGDLTFYTADDFSPHDDTELDCVLEWAEQGYAVNEGDDCYDVVEEYCDIDWTYNWGV